MSDFRFSLEVPRGWESNCRNDSAVFGSPDWQAMLEHSFGCSTIYAWNGKSGAAITTFKAGPFRVGYVGFPAGRIIGESTSLASIFEQLPLNRPLPTLCCVRAPLSAFGDAPPVSGACATNPETAIPDLQRWDLMSVSKNLRRDIRKAARSGLAVGRTTDLKDASALFEMYESSLKHHRGSLRYNPAYFSALLDLARNNSAIQIYTATAGAELAGFAVIVLHAETAYYLHGGSTLAARQLSPSDLILADAIGKAKAFGCRTFNFMASPPNQRGLVRYKEKWGGKTRSMRTLTVPTSLAYSFFKIAEKLYRQIS